MEYIKKVGLTGNLYYIQLPKKTSRVYLNINLKSGYAEENDKEFGIGHLLEHYLIGALRKLEGNRYIKVKGSIGQEDTSYSLDSSASKIVDESQIFIKQILKPDFSDRQIFQSEKETLINELNLKLNSSDAILKEIILAQRLNKECRYLKTIKDQISNIKKVNLKDLERYHHKFFTRENIVITIGKFQLNPIIIKKIYSFVENSNLPNQSIKRFSSKCFYSKFGIKLIEKDIKKKLYAVILSFPAYNKKAKPSREFILDILVRLLFGSTDGLLNQLRQVGIYDLNYEKTLLKNIGIIFFYSFIDKKQLMPFLRILNKTMKDLKNGEISKTKLKIFLDQIKRSEKKAFNNNVDRFDWINYDLVNYGRVIPIEEDLKFIDSITVETIKNASRSIFKKNAANVVIIGKNIKNIEKDRIEAILDF